MRPFSPEPAPEETRPLGVVNFASTLGDIPSQIHTFNPDGYHSPRSTGEQHGIRSVEAQIPGHYRGSNTWGQREQYNEMKRRQGVEEED